MLAAIVPLALAVLGDALLLDERIVSALLLTTPGGTTMPAASLLGSLATALPLADLETRVALFSALPAAVATFAVTETTAASSFAGPRWGAALIVLALGTMVGVALHGAPVEVAFVVLAVDLALRRPTMTHRGLSALAAIVALWAAPRHLGTIAAAWMLGGVTVPALGIVAALAMAAPLATIAWVRPMGLGGAATLPFEGHPFARVDPAQLRALAVVAVLAIVTWLGTKDASTTRPRILVACAAVAAIVVRAPGALVAFAAVLAPLAAQAGSALTMAATEVARAEQQRLRRLAAFGLVPALCLGLAARAFEVEALGSRSAPDARATRGLHALLGLGAAPVRAVWMVEDEPSLVRVLHGRLVYGLRPDVRVLPVQGLLSTLAVRATHAVMAEEPAVRDVVRALLARGGLEPSDLAPLAQRVALVADVSYARLRGVARHAQPLGTAVAFFLERIDPSDRRLRRPPVERRWSALHLAPEDPLREHLRAAAIREAKLLAFARDHEGAVVALRRAEGFGEPADHVRTLVARVLAKQSIE